jgi:hypothetical protein
MFKLEGRYALASRAWLRTALVLCARLLVAAMLVALGLFALPTSAFAQATIEQVSIPYTEGPYPVDDTCLGFGVVGILTGGGTITGQVVETDTGFHFSGRTRSRPESISPTGPTSLTHSASPSPPMKTHSQGR